MPPTHVTNYPIKYSIAIVADVDSSSMGDNFSNITPESLQGIKTYCDRSFVNGAFNMGNLSSIMGGPDSKFSGNMVIEIGFIAPPAQVKEAVEAALAVYRDKIGANLYFKAWNRFSSNANTNHATEPDFRCFRLVYEGGKWKVVYNAHLVNEKVTGAPDPKYPTPLSGKSFKDANGKTLTLESDWIATFSYTI